MKELTVEIVEELDDGTFWITGRCCGDDINVGDVLSHKFDPNITVEVVRIEVYGKQRESLYRGYVGGVIVKLFSKNGELPKGSLVIDD